MLFNESVHDENNIKHTIYTENCEQQGNNMLLNSSHHYCNLLNCRLSLNFFTSCIVILYNL